MVAKDAAGPFSIDKLVVIGAGLIGGSAALALKRATAVRTVVAVGRNATNLDVARRHGIADRTWTLDQRWTAELGDATVVLLATPVGQMPELFGAIAPHLGPATTVTDAGSTKQDVVAAARAHLGDAFARFVPSHPIAGSERSGAEAASGTLFSDRWVVLTPEPETNRDALKQVERLWQTCGALTRTLSARRHDEIFSAVSHLPHVLSFVLIAELAARTDASELFDLAGTGLRDFSRLAASHPAMWRDVCLANVVALRGDIATYRSQLDRIDAMLAARDGASLLALFETAHDARALWTTAKRADDEGD